MVNQKEKREKRAANLKKKADENENLKILLENVQFDIDKVREKAKKEIQEAKEILEGVNGNA